MLTLDWVWLVGLGVSALLVLLATHYLPTEPIWAYCARCSLTAFAFVGFATISPVLWDALMAATTAVDGLVWTAAEWVL